LQFKFERDAVIKLIKIKKKVLWKYNRS